MTDDFFTKADREREMRRKASAEGRKLGLPQHFGIFYGPDAPAHLKNALHPLPNPAEWQAELVEWHAAR